MKKRESPPFTSYQWVALSFGSVLSYAKVGSRGSSAEGSQEIARRGRGGESMLGTKAGGGTSLLLLSHLVVSVSLQTHGLPTACQATLSFTISWSLLILMSIELVMPSNHLNLHHHLLLLLSILSSIRVFSNESALHIKWAKYWSFSFRISPCNEYSGLIF